MAKKTKDETLDLFYFNSEEEQKEQRKRASQSITKKKKENTKNQKRQNIDKQKKKVNKKNSSQKIKKSVKNQEDTKEERFNFDEEIIIGLRRIDNEEDKHQNSKKKKQLEQNKSKGQVKSKENQSIKRDEIDDIPQIGAETRKKGKNKNKPIQKKKIEKKLTLKQELARKKRKAIFHVTKYFMFFIIVIGAGIYTVLSPIFNIKKVEVVGNSKISSDEIISLSEIELEQNMFQYRKEDISKKIKENAYIDTAKVNRKIPDTMEIIVAERKPSFMIQFANAYAYISSQGYILEISNQKQELPILTGLETKQENIQAGYRLCTEDLQKLGDVLKIMEAATSNKLAKLITKIDITDNDNYILTMQSKKRLYI